MTNLTPSVLTQEVAALLRGARARRDVSQAVLADAIGVSQSQLSKMLRGLRPITIDQLDLMCQLLALTLAEVIQEADENTDARSFKNPVVQGHFGIDRKRQEQGLPPNSSKGLLVTDWENGSEDALSDDERRVASTETQIEGPGEEST